MNKKNIIAIVLFIFLILSAIFYTVYTVVGKELGDYKNGTVSIDSGILDNTSNKNTVNNTTDDEKDNKTNNNTSNKVTNNTTNNTTKKPNTTNTTKPNGNSGNTTKPNGNTTSNTTTPGNTTNNNTTSNTTKPNGNTTSNTTTPGNTTTPENPKEPEVEPPKPIYSRFTMASQSSVWYTQSAIKDINFVKVSDTEYIIKGEYDLNGTLKGVPVISFYVMAPDSRFTKDIYQNARIILDNEGTRQNYGSMYVYENTDKVPYMLIPIQIFPGYTTSLTITWGDGEVTHYTIKHEHTVKEIVDPEPEENETPSEEQGGATE